MVSKIKPILIDCICNECIGQLKLSYRVEMGIYEIDKHGWRLLTCQHYPKLFEKRLDTP